MDTNQILQTLRDPMGVPSYPWIFQVLMVLLFALHIIFVNIAVGSAALSIYGFCKRKTDSWWGQLAGTLARVGTMCISYAILLGVAPLLFVQVIYDPMWYVSNSLSSVWVIAFIFIMMAGYGLGYVYYLNQSKGKGSGIAWVGLLSLLLLITAGMIIHLFSYISLQPEKWMQWYASNGVVNTSGSSIPTFQISRFLHFIIPSVAVTGIFMMLYAWYFSGRSDIKKEYLQWIAEKGRSLASVFTMIQVVAGLWWILVVPGEFRFYMNIFFVLGVLLAVVLLIQFILAKKNPIRSAVHTALTAFVTILVMSIARESLRMNYLGKYGYSIYDYKLNIDWGSFALFLATFLLGMSILSYFISIVWKSGKVRGEYESSECHVRWGNISIALLIAWIVIVAGFGIYVTIVNNAVRF